MEDLLTVKQLAEKLQISKAWIYKHTEFKTTNPIPCIRIGKCLRFEESEVRKWLKKINEKFINSKAII